MTCVQYAFTFLTHFWILILHVKLSPNWLDENWIALCAWGQWHSVEVVMILQMSQEHYITITFYKGLHRFMFTQHLVGVHNISGAAISIPFSKIVLSQLYMLPFKLPKIPY